MYHNVLKSTCEIDMQVEFYQAHWCQIRNKIMIQSNDVTSLCRLTQINEKQVCKLSIKEHSRKTEI